MKKKAFVTMISCVIDTFDKYFSRSSYDAIQKVEIIQVYLE